MSMQIQKTEVLVFIMEVSDHLFDSIDGRMIFGRRIDVASVEVDSVCIDSVVSSGDSIWVEDGEKIKNKFVS